MFKRRRTVRVTSNQYLAQFKVQTPEPQIMDPFRPRTRSQSKTKPHPTSHLPSDSHIEQQSCSQPQTQFHDQQQFYSLANSVGSGHVEIQHEAPTRPVELQHSPKHLGQVQAKESCVGVDNYVEAQHGALAVPEPEALLEPEQVAPMDLQPTPKQLHQVVEGLGSPSTRAVEPEQVAPMDLQPTPKLLRQVVQGLGSPSAITILGPSGERKSTRGRGCTTLSRIWNLPEGYKVGVQFNSSFQPIKREGGLLKRFLGTAVRKPHLVPINFKTWHKVPSMYKEGLWDIVKSKFEIPIAHEREIKKMILQKLGNMWRGHKCQLKAQYFDENKSVEEMIANLPPRVNQDQWASLISLWSTSDMKTLSKTNRALRKQKLIAHTTGTKSYAEVIAEKIEKDGVAPTEAELFILTHKRKDGTALNADSAKKIAEMEKLIAQHRQNSQSSNGDVGWQNDDDNDGSDDDNDDNDDGDDDDDDDDDDYNDYNDDDYNDTSSQVMEKGLRWGATPPGNASFLSPTVASARIVSEDRRQVDAETLRGHEDGRQVVEERTRIEENRSSSSKARRKVKEVREESANRVQGFSTPSGDTSCFAPIAAIARMVSEDNNTRQVGEERIIAHDDRTGIVEDRIRVEEARRAGEVMEKESNGLQRGSILGTTPSRNTSRLLPIIAGARIVSEKDTAQVNERTRASDEDRKRVEEDRMKVEEDRKRVEEDRRRVREDRRQAEEDRRQAQEARKQAEEDRRLAQEARKQAEEERRRAEDDRKKSDAEIGYLKDRLTWMESLVSRLLPSTDSTPFPREVLRSDPINRKRMYSSTSSPEHCSIDQGTSRGVREH